MEVGTCGCQSALPTSFLCFRQLRIGFRSLHERLTNGSWDYMLIASVSLHPSRFSGLSRARQTPHGRAPGRRRIDHPAIGGEQRQPHSRSTARHRPCIDADHRLTHTRTNTRRYRLSRPRPTHARGRSTAALHLSAAAFPALTITAAYTLAFTLICPDDRDISHRRHQEPSPTGDAANESLPHWVHPRTQHTADAELFPCERRGNNARDSGVRLTHRPRPVDAREGNSADRLSALATRSPLPPNEHAPPTTFTVRHGEPSRHNATATPSRHADHCVCTPHNPNCPH